MVRARLGSSCVRFAKAQVRSHAFRCSLVTLGFSSRHIERSIIIILHSDETYGKGDQRIHKQIIRNDPISN